MILEVSASVKPGLQFEVVWFPLGPGPEKVRKKGPIFSGLIFVRIAMSDYADSVPF